MIHLRRRSLPSAITGGLFLVLFVSGCLTDFDVTHLPHGDASDRATDGNGRTDASSDGSDVGFDVPGGDATDVVADGSDAPHCGTCASGTTCCQDQCVNTDNNP